MHLKKKPAGLWLTLALFFSLVMFFVTGCGNAVSSATSSQKASPAPKSTVSSTLADGDLHVFMLNVGESDAALVQYKGKSLLIDTGDMDHREALVKQLKERGVKELEGVIITHPHSDHLGGMAALFQHFKINHVYDNGVAANNGMYRNYLKNIKEKNIPYQVLRRGDKITLNGDVEFDVMAPEEPLFTKENTTRMTTNGLTNNNSIVCRMKYKDFSVLFCGDAQKEAEKKLVKEYGQALQSTVIKIGHHGSKTSSCPTFIKTVSPQAATISCGAGNEYKFPHKQTLETLKQASVAVYRTDTDGTISIISNGSAYKMTKEHE